MKKKTKTLPTLIGVLILTVGVAAGLVLVERESLFRLEAELAPVPKDVRISNVSDTTATISWITTRQTQGFIVWGQNSNDLKRTATSSTGPDSFVHAVNLENLTPSSAYFIKINSGGEEYDNNGLAWAFTTGPKLTNTPPSNIISGSLLTSSGAPTQEAIIYTTVGGSSLVSTLTSNNGTWLIPISTARTQDLSSYIDVSDSTLIEISVNAGPFGVSSAQIYPEAAKPAPSMFLGQTHNFKSIDPLKETAIPEASIDIPKPSTPSSRFNFF